MWDMSYVCKQCLRQHFPLFSPTYVYKCNGSEQNKEQLVAKVLYFNLAYNTW